MGLADSWTPSPTAYALARHHHRLHSPALSSGENIKLGCFGVDPRPLSLTRNPFRPILDCAAPDEAVNMKIALRTPYDLCFVHTLLRTPSESTQYPPNDSLIIAATLSLSEDPLLVLRHLKLAEYLKNFEI